MAASKVWIIEPRDPFVARDGKPFGVGVSAATLPFPFPSTTTGGVRTRAGLASGSFLNNKGEPDRDLIEQVKRIHVAGALLVELNEEGEIEDWLVAAPADALLLGHAGDRRKARVKRLVPLNVGDGLTNLKRGSHESDKLAPVGLPEFDPSKPFDGAPRLWRWCDFKKWLLEPDDLPLAVNPRYLGHNGATIETRTHVALNPQTLTAQDGQLFQTHGLEFTHCENTNLGTAKRLAMAVCVEGHPLAQKIEEGMAPLGGERRTVAWRESARQLPKECLSDITAQVAKDKALRVVLLTPAFLGQGSRPTWLPSERHGVKLELVGIANGRAQVISGWDLEHHAMKHGRVVRGQPKPTRRLLPAGSVFFLRFVEGKDPAVKTWIESLWMSCVSDDSPSGDTDQYRNDGFGLAAIGVWDGQLQTMKV